RRAGASGRRARGGGRRAGPGVGLLLRVLLLVGHRPHQGRALELVVGDVVGVAILGGALGRGVRRLRGRGVLGRGVLGLGGRGLGTLGVGRLARRALRPVGRRCRRGQRRGGRSTAGGRCRGRCAARGRLRRLTGVRLEGDRDRLPRLQHLDQLTGGLGDLVGALV